MFDTRTLGEDTTRRREKDSPVVNTLAQLGRIPGGIAQGALKSVMSPFVLTEAVNGGALYGRNETAARYKSGQSQTSVKPATALTEFVNTAIENKTNAWVPPATSDAALFTAKAADAIGEAIPAVAVAIATGGANLPAVAGGTGASHAIGAANAFTTEMVEGSGSLGKAVIAGGTEFAAEALGGKLFDTAASKISNPVLAWSANTIGEGAEEVFSGAAQAVLTGEKYTPSQAMEEFALGAVAGGVIGGAASGINAVNANTIEGRVEKAVQSDISKRAQADIADVQSILAKGNESPANAIIAQDSLTAIQRQTANPVNTEQTTTNIPAAIAERFNLRPAQGSNAKPIEVTTQSYESIVSPAVSELTAPSVGQAERAAADPGTATNVNPRALYEYAPDIYLAPGSAITDRTFTYRGQANQFYSSSQGAGSMPASGVGTSWEGKGIYSALTPHTTDMYGPSGKLPDNPYRNLGIEQKAVDVDYPIGVVLTQPANLTEDVSPLTRKDAPQDVVPEGTRRIRYDDKGRRYITEVVNNPADVSVTGLIFGRTPISEATPIRYASSASSEGTPPGASGNAPTDTVSRRSVAQNERQSVAREPPAAQTRLIAEDVETAEYTVPRLIESGAAHAQIPGERKREETTEAVRSAETRAETASRAATETNAEAEPSAATHTNEQGTGNTAINPPPITQSSERITTREGGFAQSGTTITTSGVARADTRTGENSASQEASAVTRSEGYETAIGTASLSTTPVTMSVESREREQGQTKPESPGEVTAKTPKPLGGETAKREIMTPEEKAASIWTPTQTMKNAAQQHQSDRDRDKLSRQGFGIFKGGGATGQVYESGSYNTTFGGLSSY